MIVIAGHARVLPERRQAALEAGRVMAARSRNEHGCTDYRFAVDIDDDNVIRFFEHWDTSEALDHHFSTPHFAEFSEFLGDVLDGDAEFLRYEVDHVGPLFG